MTPFCTLFHRRHHLRTSRAFAECLKCGSYSFKPVTDNREYYRAYGVMIDIGIVDAPTRRKRKLKIDCGDVLDASLLFGE